MGQAPLNSDDDAATKAESVQEQLSAVSTDVQDNIKAGIVKLQLDSAVS